MSAVKLINHENVYIYIYILICAELNKIAFLLLYYSIVNTFRIIWITK